MNERIKKLRKALDLTQQEFADKIGCSRNLIANYEIGHRNPSSSVINNICKTFNVSETWLRTGEGEMFIQRSREDELAAYMETLLQSEPEDIRRKVVLAVSHLSTEQLISLKDIAESVVADLNPGKDIPVPTIPAPPVPDIAAELAELKRQNQELAAEVAALKEEDAILYGEYPDETG